LIALLCQTEEEIESAELAFARLCEELLKNRLLGIVEFIRRRFSPAKVATEPVGELDKLKHDAVLDVTDGKDPSTSSD